MPPLTTVDSEVTAVLAAVAEPMRWQILSLLAEAELCTTHLQEVLGVGQPLISHHMRVLRESGVVLTEPCGRYTYYRLTPGVFDRLRDALQTLSRASQAPVAKRPC